MSFFMLLVLHTPSDRVVRADTKPEIHPLPVLMGPLRMISPILIRIRISKNITLRIRSGSRPEYKTTTNSKHTLLPMS